jgi:hypothetical protein
MRTLLRKFISISIAVVVVGGIAPNVAIGADVLPPAPGSPNAPMGPPPVNPPDDPNVIKDARSLLRAIEPSSSNNAMVYFDQNQVNFKSYISLEKQGAGQASAGAISCLTPSDSKCVDALADTSFQQIKYDVAMGSCHIRQVAACINSFSLVKEDGSRVKANPKNRIYNKTSPGWESTFNSKTNTGYPGADAPWIWSITDGGVSTDYLILGLVSALFNRTNGSANWDASEKSLRLSIYPVKKYENKDIIEGTGITGCLAVDAGVCYQRIPFTSNIRLLLDVRLPKVISGWLNGRLDKPVAYTENYDDNYSELIVEGNTLEEIMTGKWLPNSGAVTQYLEDSKRALTASPGAKNLDVAGVDPDDPNAVRYYSSLSKQFGNSALSNALSWRLNTTSSAGQQFSGQCLKTDGVQGIVTSNASVYEPGSPKWDGDEGALAYRIAAPIFKSDGKTQNIGRYAFAMKAELIKCVYGMSKLPAYAKVEITYDDSGEKKTASVILGSSKDWVNLHADNFEYTGAPPTVSVKLDGWSKTASNNSNSTAPSSGVKQPTPVQPLPGNGKVTITCVKGSTKKQVTGVKPQCPSGYKMQNANTSASQQVQMTITCTKGSSKKTVTGVKPKCPAGYKMSAATPAKQPATPTQQVPQQSSAPADQKAPQSQNGQQGTPNQPAPTQPGGPIPPVFDPNADITITCVKGAESKQVTGKSPVQCPSGYQMKPMGPGQPGAPGQPLDPVQPGIPMQPAKQ